MEIENETTVVETPEGAGSAPTTDTTPETVPSPEVKVEVTPEVTPEPKDNVDVSKVMSQVENLNTALKQEREAAKALRDEVTHSKETIDKLKNVFVEKQPDETTQENLTMDQLQELLDRRDEKQREDSLKETQAQAIKSEVEKLETEWSGTDGKPKYDDKVVLKWQEENSKLHLSPSEAFNEMSRDSIIDWEIKNRMAKKPDVQNVETPGGTPGAREPQPKAPVNTEDLRAAVLEAMNSNDQLN